MHEHFYSFLNKFDKKIIQNIKKRIYLFMHEQKCSLMFFHKKISENLKLNRSFKINTSTCYIIFNFFISTFIFYLSSFYYYLHRLCALTICLLYHYIYLNIVFNFLEKSYKNENQSIDENEDENETNEVKINSTLCFSNLLLSYVDYIINLHR